MRDAMDRLIRARASPHLVRGSVAKPQHLASSESRRCARGPPPRHSRSRCPCSRSATIRGTTRSGLPKRSGRRRDRSPSSSATASLPRARCGCSRELGDAFPSRISLLAFEEPEWAELTSPQLSVIRQPVRAIAREAWELLLRRMRGEAFPVQRLELARRDRTARTRCSRSDGSAAGRDRPATVAAGPARRQGSRLKRLVFQQGNKPS